MKETFASMKPLLRDVLAENNQPRAGYMTDIKKYINTPLIKVLIGQRRVGKSTLLKLLLRHLHDEEHIPLTNIFYLNTELPAFDTITTYDDLKALFSHFLEHHDATRRICIAIDEIQNINQREKFVNGYLAQYQEQCEIIITGSNSFLLSGDLSTYLTGRYIEFPIFPLSFDEFCQFSNQDKHHSKQTFIDYLTFGGLPAIFKMEYAPDPIFPYLSGVYNTIITKDIIQHHAIRNVMFFKDLYKYTLANIGNIISGKKISDYLKAQNIRITPQTVLTFLGYAQETFLLHKVHSVNPQSKKFFSIHNKYYAGDLGIRNALVGCDMKRDRGQLLENYVYLELKRHGYDITIGRLSDGTEIDFIATRHGHTIYVQVCYTLQSEKTLHREYHSLQEISDNRPKYIISLDDINHGTHNGIHHISALDLSATLSSL